MKKYFILAIVAIMTSTAFVSCDKTANGKESNDSTANDSTAVATDKVDTLASKMALFYAGQVKLMMQDSVASKDFEKDQFMKGVKEGFEESLSYTRGKQEGQGIAQMIMQMELEAGITIDKDVFLREYMRIINSSDSVSGQQLMKAQAELRDIVMKASQAKQAPQATSQAQQPASAQQ